MGISKVQQQKWVTTAQHSEFNTDIEKNNNELHNSVYKKVQHQDMESTSSTISFDQKYGFKQWSFRNTEMDKIKPNNCRNQDHMYNIQQSCWRRHQHDRGWVHQTLDATEREIKWTTIYGKNPTTTRRTTWVRYNNVTPTQWRSTSTRWLPTTSLSPSEVRSIIDIMERSMINSVECFYNVFGHLNNVFGHLGDDVGIHPNLRLGNATQ